MVWIARLAEIQGDMPLRFAMGRKQYISLVTADVRFWLWIVKIASFSGWETVPHEDEKRPAVPFKKPVDHHD